MLLDILKIVERLQKLLRALVTTIFHFMISKNCEYDVFIFTYKLKTILPHLNSMTLNKFTIALILHLRWFKIRFNIQNIQNTLNIIGNESYDSFMNEETTTNKQRSHPPYIHMAYPNPYRFLCPSFFNLLNKTITNILNSMKNEHNKNILKVANKILTLFKT